MRGKASLYEAMAEECIRDEATSLCYELRGYELWCKEVREGIVCPGMHESLHRLVIARPTRMFVPWLYHPCSIPPYIPQPRYWPNGKGAASPARHYEYQNKDIKIAMLTAGNTSIVYIAISLDATDVGSFAVAGVVW
jgi:hypothetical protein